MKLNTFASRALFAAAVAVTGLAHAGTSSNSSGSPTRQGADPAITISFSGQVAIRNFLTSASISTLRPGASITLNFPSGPVTYTATDTASTNVQLASRDFTTPDTGINYGSGVPNSQRHSALRLEWHEQGSAEGLIDLINDQVGYTTGPGGTGILSNTNSRGASVANPTWINGSSFNAGNQTINGHFLAAGNFSDTYNTSVYDRATGRNLLGAQNRVQFSLGEFKTESFSVPGPASLSTLAGSPGYGQGNPALKSGGTLNGLGFGGARQSFRSADVVNLSTNKVNPESPTNQTYAPGPWNTAGADNIDSQQFLVTAVAFVANPGTGFRRLNESDTRWLQTLGRLENGADFNTVTRSADTGQRIVAALNTGIDPSWSVGENDDGNTSLSADAVKQRSIGPDIRFSGKTSGTEARGVIAQSRLGFGPLSLAETRGASSSAPVRTLDVAFDQLTDPNTSNGSNYSAFTQVNFDTIVNGDYKAVLISHFNTIKAPNTTLLNNFRSTFNTANGRLPTEQEELNWWKTKTSAETGIKGDPQGNVAAFLNNIIQSVGTAAAGITPASANNPGDGLIINGFLNPGLLNYTREADGLDNVPRTLSPAAQQVQNDARDNFGPNFSTAGTAGSRTQTIGSGATYGALNANGIPINGTIPITAKDAAGNNVGNNIEAPKGNYLFGNFNQNGTRDYAAVRESVNAALSLAKADLAATTPGKASIFTPDGGLTNSTLITSLVGSPGWATTANTKGDLVVLGDFNSDGAFNGKDVYLLARGASLSDNSPGALSLTTASGPNFADQVRNPNARLNKNAALDYASSLTQNVVSNPDGANAARSFLRSTARAELVGSTLPSGATLIATLSGGAVRYTYDPTGQNAFNKLDVNRDGLTTFADVAIVDGFLGQSFKNISQQHNAVVALNQSDAGTVFVGVNNTTNAAADDTTPRRQISLVDVELTDNAVIDAADLTLANSILSGPLADSWTALVTHKVGPGNIRFSRSSAGDVEVAPGATLRIAGGSVEAAGSFDPFTDNTPLSGGTGTSLAVLLENGSALNISAGNKTLSSLTGSGGLSLTNSSSLNIQNNTLQLTGLSISPASQLLLNQNDLIIDYTGTSPLTTLTGYVTSSRLLSSSDVGGTPTLLVLFEAADFSLETFSGFSVDATTVIGKFTYAGDANLDGQVDAFDYSAVDDNFGSPGSFITGDLNQDGFVDAFDYASIDDTFGAGVNNPLRPAALISASTEVFIPEPSSLALLALPGLLLSRRR